MPFALRSIIASCAIGLCAGLASPPPVALADLILQQRETIKDASGRGTTSEKEIALSRSAMRIRDLDTGLLVIVRLDRRLVWEILPEGDEYIEIPFEYLETMRDFDTMTEEEILEAQLRLAEPRERIEIERKLEETRRSAGAEAKPGSAAEESAERQALAEERKRLESAKPVVEWTGREERIAGFSAREAILSIGGRTVAEVWVSNDAFFEKELDAYHEAMRSLSRIGGGATADLAALGGFPLRSILYPMEDSDAPPLVIEIVRARRESYPLWEFDVPPGARRAPFAPPSGGER